MNRFLMIGVAMLLAFVSLETRAAVFERDWKTPGDGLLTYDDVNQREWLDLTESLLSQFPAPRFDNAVAETATGGIFDGFIVANAVDVVALAQSADVNTATLDAFDANEVPTTALIRLLGITSSTSETIHSVGLLDDLQTQPFLRRFGGHLLVQPDSGPNGHAGLLISVDDDFLGNPLPGVWLYRDIPEPPTLLLVGCCLLVKGVLR